MKSDRRIPFFLIIRHLRHTNKWTLALIIFLLAIAFINLIFINSLFNGVIESNNNQIIAFRTGNITMTPATGKDFIDGSRKAVQQIVAVDGVKSAAAEFDVPGSLEFKGAKGDYSVTAINPDAEKTVTDVSKKMVQGSYLKPGDTTGIVVGADVAASATKNGREVSFTGVRVGDTLTLLLGGQKHNLIVRGIFKTKSNQADDRTFITGAALDRIAPETADRASDIVIRTDKTGDEKEVIARLKRAGVSGTFFTWEQAAQSLATVTDSFTTINALLTVVGFFIAAVTIFIIIYVDITHRRQEIGILRAVGVKSELVISTYVLQATIYSFAGVALGTALYFGIIYPYFRAYPFRIPIGDVSLSVSPGDFVFRSLTVVAVAIISGLIPAIISTRSSILDSILGR
ncbi:MAG TPA: FtsX-like permease family protein [Candidatus Anoxymicrobiaceae bacterium]